MLRAQLRSFARAATLVLTAYATQATAEPWAAPGNEFLRQDVELLSDVGAISVPITTWPLSWGDLGRALESADLPKDAPLSVRLALQRVRTQAQGETRRGSTSFEYGIAAAAEPRRLRLFEYTPRENGEAHGALTHTWERFAVRLQATYAANPSDDRAVRFDGTYVSMILGNTTISAGWQDRWWGPGRDSTLGLSTNARPVPAVMVKRNFSDPFETKWLSWIGPWTASFFFGELETSRGVPNAHLVGARLALRPLPSLELGISRHAQWGGRGRNEDFDSFVNLMLGRDNAGDDDITGSNEPGNQLAGFDWRWRATGGQVPVIFYGQMIGEDEAGGFPSRYLGQLGVSASIAVGDNGDRVGAHAEFSDTTCQFYESSKRFNCAYNSGIYPSGYRYRGRPIGHSTDNDARQLSVGLNLLKGRGERYSASIRYAQLNRGGRPDDANALSPVPSDLVNVEFTHERELFGGGFTVGVGADVADGDSGGLNGTDLRAFVAWKSRR